MRMNIDVRPCKKGIEISTKVMEGGHDKVFVINCGNIVFDLVNECIRKGFESKGIVLNLSEKTGMLDSVIENRDKTCMNLD